MQKEKLFWDVFTALLWIVFVCLMIKDETKPVRYFWMTSPFISWVVLSIDCYTQNRLVIGLTAIYASACAASFVVYLVSDE